MNDPDEDHYVTLGLKSDASEAQIASAFRALLRLHHPDSRRIDERHSASADAALQQILRAHAVLGDPVRRAEYDRRRDLQRVGSLPPVTASITDEPTRRIHVNHVRAAGPPIQPPIQVGPVRWVRAQQPD